MELLRSFIIVSWMSVNFLEFYLHVRQRETLRSAEIPLALRSSVQRQMFKKCIAYLWNKRNYHMLHQGLVFIFDAILLFTKLAPWLWKKCFFADEYLSSMWFLGVLLQCRLILDFVLLEWNIYLVAAEYGFHQQSEMSFHVDRLMKGCIKFFGGVLGTVVLAMYLKKAENPSTALHLCPFFLVATIFYIVFKDFFRNRDLIPVTTLEDGELKTKIMAFASFNEFPLDRILVGVGVARGNDEYNELVIKRGMKRTSIVLDERLIKEFSSTDEPTAMVAREIGFWKSSHPMYEVAIKIVLFQVLPLIYLGIFDYVVHSSDLYSSFGFEERSLAVGIFLFWYVTIPVNRLLLFAKNARTRSRDFKADAFAAKLGYGPALRNCLLKFLVDNMTVKDVATDSWFSAYYLSHPSFTERLAALGELDTIRE